MAKVTMVFEDRGDGVKVTMDPTAETLIKKQVSGNGTTSAEAYALFAANRIRDESKKKGSLIIQIPRIGRA